MKKTRIVETKANSFYLKGRGIPKGCKYCLKGAKVVLFLNGICQKPYHCSWYCPISEERRDKEITYADEIEIDSKMELLEEINKINAKGMSITGGEPLSELNLEKTLEYIKFVKAEKGKSFHVHLYTNGINFNETISNKLANVGLDEIRFHPPKEKWDNITFALNKGISVGVEVPAIPDKEYIKTLEDFIIFLDTIGVEFINLNEFEFCFPNSQSLKNKGFKLKEGSIASVVNSQETALKLIKKLSQLVYLKMHFCSIRAKDYYQLKNRYIRRAKNIKKPFEVVTNEGLLVFAQVEGSKKDLIEFHKVLLSELVINKDLILFNGENIKIPFYISMDDNFILLLEKYHLNGYILEMTPFRIPRYQQITEKSPIKEFKNEYGFNGN
ncbi:MAG: 4Fe-4S cluster-binding domain-containing protein [Promethearchaeota archaeon]